LKGRTRSIARPMSQRTSAIFQARAEPLMENGSAMAKSARKAMTARSMNRAWVQKVLPLSVRDGGILAANIRRLTSYFLTQLEWQSQLLILSVKAEVLVLPEEFRNGPSLGDDTATFTGSNNVPRQQTRLI
jgi:hypothetical protein